ncbi:MAG: DNA mismatch repair protein MutS [Deltaproteobacteria bacterium]|nr:DNA mismatch repair protein MutS [Deltaproteobacteria bacterium]
MPHGTSETGQENISPPGAPRATPMMRQYLELKQAHPDAILMFRLGDFYEMFFEDAEVASRLLEITLTSRDKGEGGVPMCGVPWHSVHGYVARLVENGHKVALCDQVEDPRQAKGLVRREVVQVVTPGLVADAGLIDAKAPHYLLALAPGRRSLGFAYADVTTGEFRAGEIPDLRSLSDEIARIEPREILAPADVASLELKSLVPGVSITNVEVPADSAREALENHFGVASLAGFGVEDLTQAVAAAGALLTYVGANHRNGLANLRRLQHHDPGRYLVLDEATKRNLELFRTIGGERKAGTLIHLLDRTRTAMGGRRLRQWLAFPLIDVDAMEERLDAVGDLIRKADARRLLRESLSKVHDIERLAGKVAMSSANARDLLALRTSLSALPGLCALAARLEAALLSRLGAELAPIPEVEDLLHRAIADEPPAVLTEGGLLKDGFDAEVDELRAIQRDGRGWIARLQAQERERTGISSLKVGFNRVFGYYIETTRSNAHAVPPHFERRQTLANAERFVTPELKEMEAKVLGAEERSRAREYQRFLEVRSEVARHLDRLQAVADAVAVLDVLTALAELAVERGYARPKVHEGYALEIREGRHPVVEASLHGERFVSNDVSFREDGGRLIIITGPNMAGKSTILRQTALIVLLAQMGSFVPAESATIGVVDRIFTRVGASDDLARGRSTFMVEMTETANILNNASGRSLVVLDEIGRGTSTFDGLSIAWAVAEHMHRLGTKTLFATHYHELTDLARTLRGVENFNVSVKEWNGGIIFLRRLVEGGVSRSFGIQVARLAGLPGSVVARAKEILSNLEAGELDEVGLPKLALSARVKPEIPHRQLDLFQAAEGRRRDRLVDALSREPIENMTPIEALLRLQELREAARAALSKPEKTT